MDFQLFAQWGLKAGITPQKKFPSHVFFISITHDPRVTSSRVILFNRVFHRKLHQAGIMRRFTNSPSRPYNFAFMTMNERRSNHDHYGNNQGFLFHLRPNIEDVELAPANLCEARARDLSLAVLQVPISPHRHMRQK